MNESTERTRAAAGCRPQGGHASWRLLRPAPAPLSSLFHQLDPTCPWTRVLVPEGGAFARLVFVPSTLATPATQQHSVETVGREPHPGCVYGTEQTLQLAGGTEDIAKQEGGLPFGWSRICSVRAAGALCGSSRVGGPLGWQCPSTPTHGLVAWANRGGVVEDEDLGLKLPGRLRIQARGNHHHALPDRGALNLKERENPGPQGQ